jgi:DnaJ-class molecular chaperone
VTSLSISSEELDDSTQPCRLCIGAGTYESWSEETGSVTQTCHRCGGSGVVRLGQFYKKSSGAGTFTFNGAVRRAVKKVTG